MTSVYSIVHSPCKISSFSISVCWIPFIFSVLPTLQPLLWALFNHLVYEFVFLVGTLFCLFICCFWFHIPHTSEVMWFLSFFIDTMEHHSAIKQDEILPCVTTWINVESIMLSELIRQSFHYPDENVIPREHRHRSQGPAVLWRLFWEEKRGRGSECVSLCFTLRVWHILMQRQKENIRKHQKSKAVWPVAVRIDNSSRYLNISTTLPDGGGIEKRRH